MDEGGSRIRRAKVVAGLAVGGLVVIGLSLTIVSESGDLMRDLGLAVLSGGIVGGALVLAESVLTAAAEYRSARDSLITLLSSTEDLNGIDLASQSLNNQYLPGKALVAARLDGADLSDSKLFFGDLRYASLVGAKLDGADLSGCTLAGADLTRASLRGSVLQDVDLSGANLAGADLTDSVIEDGKLKDADLRDARVTGFVIKSTHLMGTDLSTAQGLNLAVLHGNQHNDATRWPPDFQAPHSEAVTQEPIGSNGPRQLPRISSGPPKN